MRGVVSEQMKPKGLRIRVRQKGSQIMQLVSFAAVVLFYLFAPAITLSQGNGRARDPFSQFVKKLPAVDRVEVIAVHPLLSEDLKNADCTRSGLVCAPDSYPYEIGAVKSLVGDEANNFAVLWRALERATLYYDDRCLVPDHVLRFFQGDRILLESQICTLCRKVTLPTIGVVSVEGTL